MRDLGADQLRMNTGMNTGTVNTGTVLLFRNKHRDEINMGTDTKGPSLLVHSLREIHLLQYGQSGLYGACHL